MAQLNDLLQLLSGGMGQQPQMDSTQSPDQGGGLAAQLLSARFQPSLNDIGDAAAQTFMSRTLTSPGKVVNPDDIASERMSNAISPLTTIMKLQQMQAASEKDRAMAQYYTNGGKDTELNGLVKTLSAMDPDDPMRQTYLDRITKLNTVVNPFAMPVPGIDPLTGKPKFGTKQDAVNGTLLPPAAEPKPLNEYQGKSNLFATRMQNSEPIIEQYKDANTLQNKAAASAPIVGNYMVSDDYQKLDQAKRDFVNATLRQESGAAINQSEFNNAEKQYFPQPGDSPSTIEQKRINRTIALNAMLEAAGPGASSNSGAQGGRMPLSRGAQSSISNNNQPPIEDIDAELAKRGHRF